MEPIRSLPAGVLQATSGGPGKEAQSPSSGRRPAPRRSGSASSSLARNSACPPPRSTQLFSDPGKREPLLGKTVFSGAATKKEGEKESVPLKN